SADVSLLLSRSHNRAMPSRPPDSSHRPSGDRDVVVTRSVWPDSVATSLDRARSQNLMVPSYDHETTFCTSWVNRAPATLSWCPCRLRPWRSLPTLRTVTTRSHDDVTSVRPSGEKAIDEIGRVCATKFSSD